MRPHEMGVAQTIHHQSTVLGNQVFCSAFDYDRQQSMDFTFQRILAINLNGYFLCITLQKPCEIVKFDFIKIFNRQNGTIINGCGR